MQRGRAWLVRVLPSATPIFFRPKSKASNVCSAWRTPAPGPEPRAGTCSGMARIAGQHRSADAQLGQSGVVAVFRGRIEQDVVGRKHVQPGVAGKLVFEL